MEKTSQKFTQKSDLRESWASLGRGWDGLGPLWAALGRLLLVFWMFKIQLFSSMAPRWAPRSLLGRVWEGLGRIWGGFGEGLGRNLEGFGRFFPGCGQILETFGKCGPAGAKLLNWTPALIREASQCTGVRPQRGWTLGNYFLNGRLGGQAGQRGDRRHK